MSAHAARIETSARLTRVFAALRDGAEHTTLDLVVEANVCAVNSCISELRDNGYAISCTRRGGAWYYRLERAK